MDVTHTITAVTSLPHLHRSCSVGLRGPSSATAFPLLNDGYVWGRETDCFYHYWVVKELHT